MPDLDLIKQGKQERGAAAAGASGRGVRSGNPAGRLGKFAEASGGPTARRSGRGDDFDGRGGARRDYP